MVDLDGAAAELISKVREEMARYREN